VIKESSGSKNLFTVKPIRGSADAFVVVIRRITWIGEREQHWMPAVTPVAPDAPVLCGKRLPPFEDHEEDDEAIEFKTKPMCRRCSRAWSRIFTRTRRIFAASVERDLDALPIIDEPVTGQPSS
jgi:hypothetical protein